MVEVLEVNRFPDASAAELFAELASGTYPTSSVTRI
jgi:hypothetical protein